MHTKTHPLSVVYSNKHESKKHEQRDLEPRFNESSHLHDVGLKLMMVIKSKPNQYSVYNLLWSLSNSFPSFVSSSTKRLRTLHLDLQRTSDRVVAITLAIFFAYERSNIKLGGDETLAIMLLRTPKYTKLCLNN